MKEKNVFNWRTAPRSISVLLGWLPSFYKFRFENYNEKSENQFPYDGWKDKTIHPVRRKITYDYEKSHDAKDDFLNIDYNDFVHGMQHDKADKESRVRQVVTTAEQYGFMNAKDAKLTPVGERVLSDDFRAEDFLIQMLKMYVVTNPGQGGVFPFETVIKMIDKFGYLSRNEMTFVFGVLNDSQIELGYQAVAEFRAEYQNLENKNSNRGVDNLLYKVWNEYFSEITFGKLTKTVKKDYTDALTRALKFTELFYDHGRGTATKIRVNDYNRAKFEMLLNNFTFVRPSEDKNVGSRDALDWYGAVGNIELPWNKRENRVKIVLDKLALAHDLFKNLPNPALSKDDLDKIQAKVLNPKTSVIEIKDLEVKLDNAIRVRNEEEYVQILSKTKESRREILEKFDDIKANADMAALWFEVNTWRAFVSMDGEKFVKHNFNMNPDLTPKSFAPGMDNTPDMEVYFGNYAILPEVSLMSGVQQWEHEGSSVIDHVYNKIKNTDYQVIGLFISKAINVRTMWQFFLLNRESWIGKPVPVVPMTISKFQELIRFCYDNKIKIEQFNDLLWKMSNVTAKISNYQDWQEEINLIIDNWKKNKGKKVTM